MQVVLMRVSVAMLGLGAWLLIKDRSAFRIRLKDLWCFIGTGLISLLSFNWFFFSAVNEAGLAIAGALLYTAPAFVTAMSALLFKEKLRLPGYGLLVVILAGCALVSGLASDLTGSGSGIGVYGILFGLGSGIGYALYSIFGRYALNRGYSPQTISFYTFALCTLGCLPFAVASSESGLHLFAPNPLFWLYSLAIGILGCLFPYWLYTKGLSGVTGATASMMATFEPLVTALFGVFLYNELLTFLQGSGMVLILGGIVLLGKVNSAAKVSGENSDNN